MFVSKINRYTFIKKLYPDFIVFLMSKKSLITFFPDNIIYKWYLDKIFKLEINYIIIDDLDIIKKQEYKDNKYKYYFKLCFVKEILCQK